MKIIVEVLPLFLYCIQRVHYLFQCMITDMGIDLRGLNTFMTQELLYISEVYTLLQQMSGKAMPEAVDTKIRPLCLPLGRTI